MDSSEVIVVVGACGGVGASTLAALLARRRAERGRAVLLDLAATGAGLDVLLGLEGVPGARWPDLHGRRGRVDPVELSFALPRWQGVEVLSGPGGAELLAEVWSSLVPGRGIADDGGPCTVVVDAGAGRIPALLVPRGAGVLVTGQDVRGVSAALRRHEPARSVPVERWAGVAVRSRPRARLAPLEVAQAVGLPLLGSVPGCRALAEATERGLGPVPGPWSRTDRAVRAMEARLVTGGQGVGGLRRSC